MFNFPTNIRLLGFRVGLTDDDQADPDTQTGASTPGFAVPPLGYDSLGNPIQETPTIGFSVGVDPRGIVPANCTSTDGSTSCMSPGGQSFTERMRQGFPAQISPDDPNYHSYHFQSDPLDIPAEKLRQIMIANPTANFSLGRAATPQGTSNEATPDWMHGLVYGLYQGGPSEMPLGPPPVTPLNPVTSYVTKDKDGNPMVVNITERDHGLAPGYVVLYVTTSGGKSTIHAEGEGLSWLQSPNAPELLRTKLNDDTWRNYFKTIERRAK